MKVFYLFSETSNPVHEGVRAHVKKLPHATKRYCLDNFIATFPTADITLMVDGVIDGTLDYLKTVVDKHPNVSLKKIEAGCTGKAFRAIFDEIVKLPDDDEAVMIQEDDYLYLEGSERAILDALVYGDYVTGYQHPDKWWLPSRGGNPYVEQENVSEVTRIVQCPTRFWMIVNSTTGTFASTVGIIKADYAEWADATSERDAKDFDTFIYLRNEKSRTVLQPIPTLSTHVMTSYLSSLVGTGVESWDDV